MGKIVVAIGLLQILGGIFAYAAAASAIHQILGAISFGMGTICIALAVVIFRLTDIRDKLP